MAKSKGLGKTVPIQIVGESRAHYLGRLLFHFSEMGRVVLSITSANSATVEWVNDRNYVKRETATFDPALGTVTPGAVSSGIATRGYINKISASLFEVGEGKLTACFYFIQTFKDITLTGFGTNVSISLGTYSIVTFTGDHVPNRHLIGLGASVAGVATILMYGAPICTLSDFLPASTPAVAINTSNFTDLRNLIPTYGDVNLTSKMVMNASDIYSPGKIILYDGVTKVRYICKGYLDFWYVFPALDLGTATVDQTHISPTALFQVFLPYLNDSGFELDWLGPTVSYADVPGQCTMYLSCFKYLPGDGGRWVPTNIAQEDATHYEIVGCGRLPSGNPASYLLLPSH